MPLPAPDAGQKSIRRRVEFAGLQAADTARSLVLRWFFRIGFLRRDVIFQRAAHVFIFHVIHALFLLVILQKPWISKIRRCFFKLALL